MSNQPPPRGSLVAMLTLEDETSSRISMRSSASFARRRRVRLGHFLGHDLNGVSGRRLDVDSAVDVADFDPATGRELVGLPPLGRFGVLEVGGDDVAALKRDEADKEEG